MSFEPKGPFAGTLFSYLSELSRDSVGLVGSDMELLVDNIANLILITSGRQGSEVGDTREIRRRTLVQYLKKEAADPDITLESVAGELNLSRRLIQQILNQMDTSFTRFVTEERLQMTARKLVRSPSVSVSQVAYNSGFSDISHFNHLFKRRFGLAPSDYRVAQQEGESP